MTETPTGPGPSTPEPPPRPNLVAPEPPPAPSEAQRIETARHRNRTRGGIGAGVVLVVVGALLLAAQFMPTVSFWALWPLIIVAVGAVQAATPGENGWSVNRFFDGLVTIAFGLVLLGCTLSYLPWSIWWQILWLWPVLLISAGIGLIGRAIGQRWLGAIGSALVICALAWAAAATYAQTPIPVTVPFVNTGAPHTLTYSAPLEGATSANLSLKVGAATVTLGPGSELVAVSASSPWAQPTASLETSGSSPTVKVSMDQRAPVALPSGSDSYVKLALSREVAWSADVDSGATDMTLDFSQLQLARLNISTGASDVKLTLGDSRAVEGAPSGGVVTFQSGVSSLVVRYPAPSQVRVHSESALVGANAGKLRSMGSGTYETPGFDPAKPFWDVTMKSAVGSWTLATY